MPVVDRRSVAESAEVPDAATPDRETSKRATISMVPRLRLLGETVLLEDAQGEREVQAAVASFYFDYSGEIVMAGENDFELDLSATQVDRDRSAEANASRLLESFGAVELEHVEGILPDYDSQANYMITLASEVHIGCSFAGHAVQELERHGFQVEVDPSFPFPTLPPTTPWYGSVEPDEKLDWFNVELGIEINGKPYNLVPSLIEMLEDCAEGTSFESLANCPSKFRAVPLGDGRYVVVPWKRLERILAVLADLYPSDGREHEDVPLPMARVAELDDLNVAFEETGPQLNWLSGSDWLERAQSIKQKPAWTPQPAALRATLRPYQHEGLMWLEHKRDAGVGAVLADDMGLGKTLQTIALLAREKEARRMDIPTLIIAPTSLVFNWEREINKFAPHLRTICYTGPKRHRLVADFEKTEVILTSYPVLIRDLTPLTDREFHYVILDEAQAIKNERSLASTAVRTLSARHRLALTGTPVENNLGELWALFEFTHPGLLGRQTEFRKNFRDPIEKQGDEERLEVVRSRVAPFILRRLKESVAHDLPPKTELVRSIDLTGDQRDLYESIRLAADADVRTAIRRKGIGGSAVTILDALMKLRQVCCDPRIVPVESARKVKKSAKYQLFFELLQAQLKEGRRVLVFSQFAQMLALLQQGMSQRGIKSLCLTGSTRDRQALVDDFEAGKADVFLISLKAGGTGLNLVSADTVIHYDPWWNAAAQMQATDRAYRIGQKNPVFVYNLIAGSSVEERMMALQKKKRHLADTILGKAGSISALSAEDVDDLFAPLAPKTQAESERNDRSSSRPGAGYGERDDEDDNALAPK